MNKVVAILVDTRGPEVRIGQLGDEGYLLEKGSDLILTTAALKGSQKKVPVNYPGLPQDLAPGRRILIDDGLITLQVEAIEGEEICCGFSRRSPEKQQGTEPAGKRLGIAHPRGGRSRRPEKPYRWAYIILRSPSPATAMISWSCAGFWKKSAAKRRSSPRSRTTAASPILSRS